MSDNNPDMTTADNPSASERAALPSPGEKLKKLREEMGLSHARVADALHMTAHYVKALECDEYDKLPGMTFVKGYFRAYARLLGADEEETMQVFEHYVTALEETEESEANVIRARKAYDQNMRWMLCAAFIIVVVVGASWWFSRDNADSAAVAGSAPATVVQTTSEATAVTAEMLIATLGDKPTATGPADIINTETSDYLVAGAGATAETGVLVTDVPAAQDASDSAAHTQPEEGDAGDAVTTLVTPTSTLPDYKVTRVDNHREVSLESEGDDVLHIQFTGASWIEVDNGNNTRLYHDMLNMGDALSIKGKAPFNILFGDANVVDVTFNSRTVDVTTRMRSDNSARVILAPEN